jgi:hypothetical protein
MTPLLAEIGAAQMIGPLGFHLLVGFKHEWIIFHHTWDVILPIDELIFFGGVGIPPSSTKFEASKMMAGLIWDPTTQNSTPNGQSKLI